MIGRGGGRGGPGCAVASRIAFDDTNVCITADNVQEAIEALEGLGIVCRATAGESVSIGEVIYIDTSGEIKLAQADAKPQAIATGIMLEAVAMGGTGCYLKNGKLTMADWTTVAGTTTLSMSSPYFLSTTGSGNIATTTAAPGSGEYAVRLGKAVASDTLDFEVQDIIRRC